MNTMELKEIIMDKSKIMKIKDMESYKIQSIGFRRNGKKGFIMGKSFEKREVFRQNTHNIIKESFMENTS